MINKCPTLQIKNDLLDFEMILPNKTESEENYFSSQVHSIMALHIFCQNMIIADYPRRQA
ncbi:hypothetical protein T03_17077 [Trichinella britovi]|uniref:Uncharacterized protein n=1 Tax=Trichinella britovi TaxID=45882 RepID=A0A0V1C342_TRIBR|nr:hypothetical protein T03_17077 [Trichinella britovi]KRZ83357.1 hypothetical protein T08_12733 [Trichinella sp. T8]